MRESIPCLCTTLVPLPADPISSQQFVDDATLVRENSGVAVSTADAEREEEDDAEQAET